MNMIAAIKPAEVSRWQELRVAYEQARAAELAFDRGPYNAAIERAKRQGPCAVFDERWTDISDRITDIRADAEDELMAEPAPDAGGFALKYLIAKGGGRDTDKWDDLLENEALRFSSQHVGPAAGPDPHMGWFAVRQRLMDAYGASHDANPDGDPSLWAVIVEISRRIADTPATTHIGMLAKALLVVDDHLGLDDTAPANKVMAEVAALNMIEVDYD